jgi:hypothetical protein
MSNDIRIYKSHSFEEDSMSLTAFVGGKKGSSIQFSIAGHYCQLGKIALKDLIKTIEKRLNCDKDYSATDNKRKNIIFKE